MATAIEIDKMDSNAFDASLVDSVDQSSVLSFDDIYPSIQWVNGEPKRKKEKGMLAWGGWFMAERSNTPDEENMLAAGWEKQSLMHDDGSETAGFYKRDITVIAINVRERWQVRVDGDQPLLFGYDRRDKSAKWDKFAVAKTYGSPSGRLQVLVLLKGMEDFGAFVLTLGGSVAMAFHNERGGDNVLGNFFKTILAAANAKSDAAARAANRKTGKKWPVRAFYLSVGPAREANGTAIYTEVGQKGASSYVTLPVALGLPGRGEAVDLNEWYVGNNRFATVNEMYDEAETGWARAWDVLAPTVTPNGDPKQPAVMQQVNAQQANELGL
jgi:hypothetical protein